FKAESGLSEEELIKRSRARMQEYGLYAIVANDIDSAGKTSTSAIIVTPESYRNITGTKENIADSILDRC
ncbi:MAG: bifunctional phosphopantothenoylcysteine decarboxylase/phosphopantothenate--cysteine ligase CoaBC, partial [Candidatus Methanomethylophilaceae archaeon]|nr:bifunctional phosphopantothenoylcysteine decarboxylase/phosphopantothenate--cysteine ligase CoaBC [Candidatus Methanomethylophilaceae archaeon]